jgi:hypothetical protein
VGASAEFAMVIAVFDPKALASFWHAPAPCRLSSAPRGDADAIFVADLELRGIVGIESAEIIAIDATPRTESDRTLSPSE